MFDYKFGKNHKDRKIVDPYDLRPTKAKITIEVDLVTQQVALSCDKTLPGLMIVNILCQSASGYLMEMQKLEAMTVGRGSGYRPVDGLDHPEFKPKENVQDGGDKDGKAGHN
jgi:hypothetical protein